MYEFNVYFRGTKLIAGPAIWAKSLTAARQILKQQECNGKSLRRGAGGLGRPHL